MNFPVPPEYISGAFCFGVLWSLAVTVFWMVIGWRAMRAHELLARSHNELQNRMRQAFAPAQAPIDAAEADWNFSRPPISRKE
jgi:hypothetical protein